jgi:hypothetical protein
MGIGCLSVSKGKQRAFLQDTLLKELLRILTRMLTRHSAERAVTNIDKDANRVLSPKRTLLRLRLAESLECGTCQQASETASRVVCGCKA